MIAKSTSRKVFEVINYTLFTLFCITIIIPFLNVISISLSSYSAITEGKVTLWPVELNTKGYEVIMTNMLFLRSVLNSTFITIVNTFLVIIIALSAGYALANKDLVGKKVIFTYLLIPMYFSGGLIPTYLLINNWLRLNNNYLALILPSITSIFYIIIFRNSISQLPQEIVDSGQIDGASEYVILFKLIIPLILPMIMAFTIFSAVAYWNEWFGSMLYMRDVKKWTLQYRLRDILINSNLKDDPNNPMRVALVNAFSAHPKNLRMAALMITIIPIVAIYPFLQKYFIHGVIVGAVKG